MEFTRLIMRATKDWACRRETGGKRERERREEGGGERAGMGMVESDRKGQKEGGMN